MRRIEQLVLAILGILIAVGSIYFIIYLLQTGNTLNKSYPALVFSSGTTERLITDKDRNPHFRGYQADSLHHYSTARKSRAIWQHSPKLKLTLNSNTEINILQSTAPPYQLDLLNGRLTLSQQDTSHLDLHTPGGVFRIIPEDNNSEAVITRSSDKQYIITIHQGRLEASSSVSYGKSPQLLQKAGAIKITLRDQGDIKVTRMELPSEAKFRYPKNEMGFALGELQQGLRLTWDSTHTAQTELQLFRKADNGQLLTDWITTSNSTWLWQTSKPGDYIWVRRAIHDNGIVSPWSQPITVGVLPQFRTTQLQNKATTGRPSIQSKTQEKGYLVGGYIQPDSNQALSSYRVILYAKPNGEQWFIQPRSDHFLIPVTQDGYWESYVHPADSLRIYWTNETVLADSIPNTLSTDDQLPIWASSWKQATYALPISSE